MRPFKLTLLFDQSIRVTISLVYIRDKVLHKEDHRERALTSG